MKFPVAILLMALASTAHAGLTVTEKSAGWRVLPAKTADDPVLKDIAACREAVKLRGPGEYTCVYTAALKVVGTCDDVPMPVWPTKVNAEGFIVQPGLAGDVKDEGAGKVLVVTKKEGFVKGPGWPDCWVPGLVPYDGELPAPDGPASADVGPWVYCVDYGKVAPFGKTCPKEAKGGCYIPSNAPDVCPVDPK